MLAVTNIEVRTFDLDHLDIFWCLKDTNESVELYDFYIERSLDGMAGPYRQIAGPFYNSFQFRDPDVHQLHRWRRYYYRIRVVNRDSGMEETFGPQWLQATPDRIALEIQRREGLMFKEMIGRIVLLYPAVTTGQRCVHCWDRGVDKGGLSSELARPGNTIGRSTQQNCATCFDTTFVGGYATPMRIHMQIDPFPDAQQRTDLADRQFTETTARTTAYPPIKPKDLVIEAENVRWRVESPLTKTEKLRATVRQELKLRQYPRGDIKYKVPVTSPLQDDYSPPREFTRPMTVPTVDTKDGQAQYSQPEIEGHGPFWWEGTGS